MKNVLASPAAAARLFLQGQASLEDIGADPDAEKKAHDRATQARFDALAPAAKRREKSDKLKKLLGR